MSTTSLLQTALQNLHVAQQRDPSYTPQTLSVPGSPRRGAKGLPLSRSQRSSRGSSPPDSDRGEGNGSDDDTDAEGEGELVAVGKGTAPGTPTGTRGLVLGLRGRDVPGRVKDPLRTLPTHLSVRVFLQLDIRSLARCDRVCKRWHKSSTMNYVWFLHNRALTLPSLAVLGATGQTGKMRKTGDDTPDFFDPYDKTPRLSALPRPPLPTSTTPQWSKAESKKTWKGVFRTTLKRSDPNAPPEVDHLRVDVDSLHSSGYSTPSGGFGGGAGHVHAGTGSGGAAKWGHTAGGDGGDAGGMTPTEKKVAARENYRAMGGRKSRGKRRMGGELGSRDRGGAVDDGRFDAPW